MAQNELFGLISDFFQKLQDGNNEYFKKYLFELLDKILSDKAVMHSLLKGVMKATQVSMYETNDNKIIDFLDIIRFLIMTNGIECRYKNYKYPISEFQESECDTLAVKLNNGISYEIFIKKVV